MERFIFETIVTFYQTFKKWYNVKLFSNINISFTLLPRNFIIGHRYQDIIIARINFIIDIIKCNWLNYRWKHIFISWNVKVTFLQYEMNLEIWRPLYQDYQGSFLGYFRQMQEGQIFFSGISKLLHRISWTFSIWPIDISF
jgi:hypothetical protein